MSRPFDLAAARAGEPIEYLTLQGNEWIPVHFVGTDMAGNPVVQRSASGGIFPLGIDGQRIRMAPKKVTMRYRVALCQGAHSQYVMAVQEGDPEPQLRACGFIDWLDEWKSVEVPQGGE